MISLVINMGRASVEVCEHCIKKCILVHFGPSEENNLSSFGITICTRLVLDRYSRFNVLFDILEITLQMIFIVNHLTGPKTQSSQPINWPLLAKQI